MSKLTDAFREVSVYNPHGFYNGDTPAGQVYIDYKASDPRSPFGPRRQVIRVGFRTDRDSHWHDNGHKTFTCYGGREAKAAALTEAQKWAERYGITEWARDPFGCYGDAGFVKARVAELKALAKSQETT